MYTKFFGLKKRPFVLSPDPDFLFLSRGHDLALTHLEYGLNHNVGFIALTGEVGAGKTTLLKFLFDRAPDSLDTAMLLSTHLDPTALLETLIKEFGVRVESNRKSDLVDALFGHFLDTYSKGGRCVIVVDEAQNLPLDSFEELRMLSNLEGGSEFLTQIVLVGQPELKARLKDPALWQLTQRISVHYHLSPLSSDEVGAYIEHRLRVGGYEGEEPIFTPEATTAVSSLSGGIPRLISSICDAALSYGFADDARLISGAIIERVVSDNELLSLSSKRDDPALEHRFWGGAAGFSGLHDSRAADLSAWLASLETRVRGLESAEGDRAATVLRQLLAEEKERSNQNAIKAAFFEMKCKRLASQVEELKKVVGASAPVQPQEPRKLWRLIRGEKS